MSFVKRGIQPVRRPEVGRAMLPVAPTKTVLQQSSATPFVPVQSLDADEREVPMGLGRSVLFRLLEHGTHVGSHPVCDALRNDRLKHRVIAVNTRREPERDAETVAGSLGRARVERAGPEGA